MRITFDAMYRSGAAGLETSSERLLEFQRQVSTGKRVNGPSDDPSGTLGIIREKNEIKAVEQYARAADSVKSRLTVMDTVMADMINQVTAAEVAAASARGSTKTAAQLQAAATELEGIRDALFSDLIATFSGVHLFAGAAGDTPPFTRAADGTISAYAGATEELEIDVDRSRAVRVGVNGDTLARGSDTDDIFTAFTVLVAAVRAGDADGIDAGRAALDRMFTRITTAQGRLGADLRIVDDQKLRLGEMKRAAAARVSGTEEVNMAEAISGMTQAEAAYRAALGATGTVTRMSLFDYLR